MARVTIVIEDIEVDSDGRPHVNIHMESDPPFALDGKRPALEEWSQAQAASYAAIETVIGGAATAEMIVVDRGAGAEDPQ